MPEAPVHGPGAVAERYGDDVALLDTGFAGREATIGVYLVPAAGSDGRAGRFDLVEAGPASCFRALEDAVARAGFDPAAVDTVLVTHAHLDHAAGAGHWAREHGARVVADVRAAPHLADPSRLLASARRVYGDALEAQWGEMASVPIDQLRAVADGETLRVGGRTVRVLHTPGHASHHASFLWEDGACYVGDVAGISLPGSRLVRPALPPPETDLEAAEASLARLASHAPDRLRLTHFGEVREVDEHLREVARRNREWAEWILELAARGWGAEAVAEGIDAFARQELEAAGADAATIRRHLTTSDAAMTAAGVLRYWRTRHPERWQAAVGG